MIPALITTSIITTFLAGFAKAICDLSEEGKLKFYRKTFWIKDLSWVNKYKLDKLNRPIRINGKYVEKFWGSTTIFVMFTDAWHLFGFIERIALITSFTIVGFLASISLYYLFGLLINYIIFISVFNIFYTYKILRK